MKKLYLIILSCFFSLECSYKISSHKRSCRIYGLYENLYNICKDDVASCTEKNRKTVMHLITSQKNAMKLVLQRNESYIPWQDVHKFHILRDKYEILFQECANKR